jgi:filamentous hemagglutinin
MKSTRNLVGVNVLALLALCGVTGSRRAAGSAQLPVPCVGGTCGPAAPGFVYSGQATAVQAGNTLTVNQSTDKTTLNWQSFNISADGKVQFVQPSANSVALNRIYQQTPSSIFGQLTANGQIYLVNPNGILFGATAKVNTAGLIASSLGISDDVFNQGLLAPALLAANKPALSASYNASNPVQSDGTTLPGAVIVQQGATISTPSGRILLAAPTVQNAGTLSAPDGQVVLAAGQDVYLQASTDSSLRGLVVEVDHGGKAWNQLNGELSAPRGNISMVGLAVNQDGRISATTTVAANGSVRLEAADTHTVSSSQTAGAPQTISATNGGTLTIGAQSSIDIDIDSSNTDTAAYSPNQLQSTLSFTGQQVFFEGGSIKAPNANLKVVATSNPTANPGGVAQDGNADAQIRIHSGTSIDLSGSTAELPVDANLLAIQLRANELADDPTQRNGALRGQTVYVDTRVGTSIIGGTALQAAEQAVARNEAFWSTKGGTASFQSEGDIVAEQGSSINVSGGKTIYDGGSMQTTQLLGANGRLYDIGSASQLMTYTGVVNPTFTQNYDKWGVQTVVTTPGLGHYESGYVDGASAGSIQFAASGMALGGTLLGQAVNGTRQRSGSNVASGGTLILGLPKGLPLLTPDPAAPVDYLAPSVIVVENPAAVTVADGTPLGSQPLRLGASSLTTGGFTNIQVYSNASFTVAEGTPLTLNPGTSLLVDAPRIDIGSSIISASGNIQLQSVLSAVTPVPNVGYPGIQVESGVTLDVRGQWTNDSAMQGNTQPASGPTLQDGGNITLDASQVDTKGGVDGDSAQIVLGDNVSLRASGGGWVSTSNVLTGGKGGSISITSAAVGSALQIGNGVELDAFGVNGATGGQFSLRAPRIEVSEGTGSGNWADAQRIDELTQPGKFFDVHSSLFSDFGFSSVSLMATAGVAQNAQNPDVLAVDANTLILAQQQTMLLNPGYLSRATGTSLDAFSHQALLPAYLRSPASVSLSVVPQVPDNPSFLYAGRLDVETGAQIITDPGVSGKILLTGVGGVYIDGKLSAPGGTITLNIPTPPSSPDPGYVPNLAIELGPDSVLDTSGTFIQKPSAQGLLLGTVLDGGSVNLLADRGMVMTDPGSLVDVNGASATLDIPIALGSPTYKRQSEGSAGGSVTVHSPEAISLRGNFKAAAGSGSYGDPAGGSLEVDLTRAQSWFKPPGASASAPYPDLPFGLVIDLVSSTQGLATGAPDGLAILGQDQIVASGFDALHLVAGNTLRFSSSNPLSLTRQIILDAPTIQVDSGVQAAVGANYVQIADSQLLTLDTTAVQAGTGTFSAGAQQIDLLGAVAFSGTQKVALTSAGDMLLRGVSLSSAVEPLGSLVVNGELDISASRIYPATQTAFSIEALALGTNSSVNIGKGNQSPAVPLSAGGSISITADNIDSYGTLLAPFGMISLVANNDLTLESTSITSVSAAGATIPFGYTELGGKNWVYGASELPVTGIPTRQVSLSASNLVQQQGAKIDLSGGGDLYAYEYVPGTGGTSDALAGNSTSYPGLYAVLPSMLGQFAPYDPQETGASTLQPGANIYLSGIAGLAAGYYPLLPARDALLPGAFLVKVETGYSNIVPGQQSALTDGTPVIAGYLSFGTTGQRDGGFQGVAVWPGSYGRTLATYQDSYASAFFAAAAAAADEPRPSLPVDAGRLSLSVDANLTLKGTVLTGAGSSSGLGAVVDISAPNLEVISDQGTPTGGAVGVLASTVSSWQAGTLLLGGHVTSADGLNIAVNSDTVTVDAGAQLQAGQVILVANQQIDLKSGSSVMSTSAGAGGKAPAALPLEADITLSNASGAGAALLAVSDLELPVVAQRAPASANLAGINIDTGATVASRGAIAIDAPGTVSIGDGALNASGAALSLASSSIGLGAGTGGESMQLTQSVIGEMQSAGAIRLSSLGAIDLNTAVQLGSRSASGTPSISSLTLSAQSLNNTGAGDGSTFTAAKITLDSPTDFTSASPSAGSGSLTFDSNEFELGAGTLAVSGFASTHVTATSEFSAQQQQPAPGAAAGGVVLTGGLVTAGDLSITAPIFTAGTGALGQISALNGTLSLIGSGGTAATSATGLGGALEFSADAISVSGLILAPSGKVTLQATHDINFASTAGVDVSGRTVTIGNQTVGSEGGNVLMSAGGNLTLASGSSINVSAAGDTPAGQILLTAVGNADIGSQLQGKASSGAAGGIFNLDAGSLSQSLDTLGSALQSGGFSSEVDLRVHTGNLVLSSAGQITSNKVNLTADTGTVDIAGTVSAPSADLSGTIGLFGGQGVTLESTGQLIADTQGTARGIGGTIELGTGANGSVTLASGSLIEASGSTADGTLRIRAPLINGGTDIAVNWAGSKLSHLSGVYVEPVLTEAASLTGGTGPTADDYTRIQSDISSMMTGAASNISNRLNPTGASSFHVRPAVDVVQNGDLTLDVAPDLSTWQFNGQPVDLAFRATGNLTVNANITDGFQTITAGNGDASIALLPNYASADLRFVGGADIGSANPLATVAGAAADVKIAGNTTVATGTGEIDLVASRDIVFADTGAKVYTAGTAGADYQPTGGIRVLNFPTGGGNVLVDAGRDIQGVAVPRDPKKQQAGLSPSTWQTRNVSSATSAEWGVDFGQYATYGWNVGSLGGGDVSVSARGDMANISVAVADSYLANANGPSTHFASGSLDVRAVGDIGAGDFYVANGSSLSSAGGSFNSGSSGSLIAMGDAQVSVEARLGVSIDGVINPTLYVQDGAIGTANRFFTYSPESAITVQTSAGEIDLGNNIKGLLGTNAVNGAGGQIYPGNLIARSLSGDLTVSAAAMFPSANGQLQLLAGRNIIGNSNALSMSDAPAASVATAENPGVSIGNLGKLLDQGDIHSSDPNPAVVVAGQDISALVLNVPKPAEIIAGRDITDLSLRTQNLNSSDLTLISAGRDYTDDNSSPLVSVGGPGRLALLAGRNVDLGVSGGIVTTGNLNNANLPTANGADLTVMAGLGQSPDLAGFLQKIVVPSASDQALLVSSVESLSGRSGLSFTDAESLFSAYSVDQQRDLLNQIFFHELEVSGQADNTVPGAGFTEGYAAIDAMFPNSRTAVASGPSPYSGDLSLAFSRIYTLSGGDISLLVPGGLINVGLANPPASLLTALNNRRPSDLGIVAEGPGNINIYTKGDVDVNASRIFTLGGGNIMIWSDEGNIDAGRGSKSSLSAPPPTVLVDSAGNISLNFTGAVAGSGIRTIQVNPSVSPGNVELIAPIGTVNAGDAGIGASGNIVIAAAHVLGLDNIQFGGTATGVPAQVSDIGVTLAAASSVSSGATNTASSSAADEARKAATAAPITQAAISWLEVFLTGLGEENCRTDDLDCLKRQPKH